MRIILFSTVLLLLTFATGCDNGMSLIDSIGAWNKARPNSALLSYTFKEQHKSARIRWQVGQMYHDFETYKEMFKSLSFTLFLDSQRKFDDIKIDVYHEKHLLYNFTWTSADFDLLQKEHDEGWFAFVDYTIDQMSIEESVKMEAIYTVMKIKVPTNSLPISWWGLYHSCYTNDQSAIDKYDRYIEFFIVCCDYPEFDFTVPEFLRIGCRAIEFPAPANVP
jgi:hypothetical protein